MKYYALTLRADSPLAIRADHAPGGAASAQYIPGTALAGSLAATYRLLNSDDDSDSGFQDLFLNEQVWFPNLYPASFKKSEKFQNATGEPIYPLPKTAQSCKRFPGFHPTQYETDITESRHGVRDSLLDWAMFALADQRSSKPDLLLELLEEYKRCPVCGKLERPMDNFTGYYRRLGPGGPMLKATVDTRLQTHNGINRQTGTVQEGILYNREVIEEDACFWGLLKLSDTLEQPFKEFIDRVTNNETGWLRVGTGRTRGLGKAGLRIVSPRSLTDRDDFRKRLEGFDTKLREKAHSFNLSTSPFYFALTLHSPVILSDGWQGYYTGINGDTLLQNGTLENRLGLPEKSLKRLCQFSSTRRVTGWNDLWGTPRANELAIDTGSVFLFSCDQSLDDTLTDALYRLEEEGIGRRKAEGFGRICISDQFHQEVTLQ